jgi:TMEM175 potassium channel family protein
VSEQPPPRRLSEPSRVEAFSDGVYAIAITLLVLELAVPTVRGDFAHQLAEEWVSYVAYLAAFANIGVLWMIHHTVFTRIVALDSGVLWRNLVILLTVSVVPFPTAVIASAYRVPGTSADQSAAVIAYAIVGMSSGLAWTLMFRYLRGNMQMIDERTHRDFFRLAEPLLTVVGYGVAAVVGWFAPSLAFAFFVAFPVAYVVRIRTAL